MTHAFLRHLFLKEAPNLATEHDVTFFGFATQLAPGEIRIVINRVLDFVFQANNGAAAHNYSVQREGSNGFTIPESACHILTPKYR